MRVTNSMYYENLYGTSNTQLNSKLFDVNKQISSGLKIQYAKDDVRTFTETMRLDNEMTTLGQIKKSTETGYKISNQTDIALNEFTTAMDRTRVLLIQASNGAQSFDSREAIVSELRSLETHFKSLANTSINGQFLFSGSATDTKPISADGTYNGNDISMNSFLGSGVNQQHNLSGSELFLGEEANVKRKITTNIPQYSLTQKYPDFTDPELKGIDSIITTDSTIRDLMGDIVSEPLSDAGSNHLYISGAKSNGDTFSEHITMTGNETVDDLLTNIGNIFGNTPNLDLVNVSLNQYGEIVVEDKLTGSSKLDFHMVGAIDYNAQADGNDAADIDDGIYTTAGLIDNLKNGETDFKAIIDGTSLAADSSLYIKNFVRSEYTPTSTYTAELKSAEYTMDRAVAAGDTLQIIVDDGDATTTTYTAPFNADAATTYDDLKTSIEADGKFTVTITGDSIKLVATSEGAADGVSINTALSNDNGSGAGVVTVTPTIVNGVLADIGEMSYDRTKFTKDGSKLSSTTPQIIKETNAFASPSTKISEVADISNGTVSTADDTLDGTQFTLSGTNTSGTAFTAQIDFATAGSTFSLDGGVTSYDIFDVGTPRAAVAADDMTYQQLMDVINMVVSGDLPATNNSALDDVQEAIDYDTAVKSSNSRSTTYLSYDGKIQFEEISATDTNASIALHDTNAGNFNSDASVITFNTNNALTISDPKTDFFKSLDEIITSVEEHKLYPDGTTGIARSIGMEDAIAKLDDLHKHLSKSHASVGANSKTLTMSIERTSLLEVSTMTLRSEVIDTDFAEASLKLTQLSLNYQAMLSTVNKVSQLSLVNYL